MINETKAKVNQEFTLSLEGIPAAGYIWEAHFDDTFLQLKEKHFELYPESGIGGGGTETFTFIPLKKGVTVIRMYYKRPWESEIAEERQYQITVCE